MSELKMKCSQLKKDIENAWRKNRLPSFFKNKADVFIKTRYRETNENFIIALMKPCFIVDCNYSKEYLDLWIDLFENYDEWLNFIKREANPNCLLLLRGVNILNYEVK